MGDRRAAIEKVSCYSCRHTLASAAPTFNDGIWTVVCPACAVVNKLKPIPDREGHFMVSGAFIVVQKSPGN